MATTLTALHPKGGRRTSIARPTVLAVLHPKGGVGRSTTVWQLGAELALRGKRVRISTATETYVGTTAGLEPNGLLRVERDDGRMEVVTSGDVAEAS